MKRSLFLAILLVAPAVRADPAIRTYTDDNSTDWYYYEREDNTCVIMVR